MTALEVIKEIRRLPMDEREKVKTFLGENLEEGQLSSEELGQLTRQMVEAKSPQEANSLQEEIIRGFYGNAPHA